QEGIGPQLLGIDDAADAKYLRHGPLGNLLAAVRRQAGTVGRGHKPLPVREIELTYSLQPLAAEGIARWLQHTGHQQIVRQLVRRCPSRVAGAMPDENDASPPAIG